MRRYLALIEGLGPPDGYRLIDIKQCEPSPIPACTDAPQPDWGGDEAPRVVRAQTVLQGHPAAGLDVLPFGSKSYRIREMIPDENRTRFDRFRKQPAELRQAVETAGTLTAWSHLRGARKAADPCQDLWPELGEWSAGAAVDSILAAAARYADRTNHDFVAFQSAVRESGGPARCLESFEPESPSSE